MRRCPDKKKVHFRISIQHISKKAIGERRRQVISECGGHCSNFIILIHEMVRHVDLNQLSDRDIQESMSKSLML